MPDFSELIVKDELTDMDRKDLQRMASEIERIVYDLADTIGTTGATFSHRATFQRALNVFTTGMTFLKSARGLVFHNAKAGAHRAFLGVIDATTGEFRIVLDDDLATNDTANTFSVRRDPADPDNVGQFNFSIQGGDAGATKVTIGGEVEIWAGEYAAAQGKTTVFNEKGLDIDFRIEGDTDANNFVSNAGTDNIGIGTATPATSAKLEISSTVGAVLLPRMTTTQRDALTAVNGMLIYNSSNNVLEAYENGSWVNI